MPQKCRNVTNIGGDGSSLFRHRHFGTLDISICVPYGPLDVPAHGHFISTDVPAQGHYGIGMLRHWDVFTGGYFDTCRTSPGSKATSTFQQETFWQIHLVPKCICQNVSCWNASSWNKLKSGDKLCGVCNLSLLIVMWPVPTSPLRSDGPVLMMPAAATSMVLHLMLLLQYHDSWQHILYPIGTDYPAILFSFFMSSCNKNY